MKESASVLTMIASPEREETTVGRSRLDSAPASTRDERDPSGGSGEEASDPSCPSELLIFPTVECCARPSFLVLCKLPKEEEGNGERVPLPPLGKPHRRPPLASESSPTMGEEEAQLAKKIRDFVECPICLSTPVGERVLQCKNGHWTCETCMRRIVVDIGTCSFCQVSLRGSANAPSRNLVIEQMVLIQSSACDLCGLVVSNEFLSRHKAHECVARTVHCKDRVLGCYWEGAFADLPSHRETDCPFAEVGCPEEGCSWKGTRQDYHASHSSDCLPKLRGRISSLVSQLQHSEKGAHASANECKKWQRKAEASHKKERELLEENARLTKIAAERARENARLHAGVAERERKSAKLELAVAKMEQRNDELALAISENEKREKKLVEKLQTCLDKLSHTTNSRTSQTRTRGSRRLCKRRRVPEVLARNRTRRASWTSAVTRFARRRRSS